MEYTIEFLNEHRKYIERQIKQNNLMMHSMSEATVELQKVAELKQAIKWLKEKKNKYK